jgi:hypothetical protein
MKFLLVPLAAIALVPLAAQAPHVITDALGFTYTVPEDWQVVMPKLNAATSSPTQPQGAPDELRKGVLCVDVPMTATHGSPPTVIVIVTLPFDCFGQTMSQQDLPGFGLGVTEGLKVALDIFNPVEATYTLAGHNMWIERVKATPKGKSAAVFTVETTCTLLAKGAVCWMAQASDEAGLTEFEHTPVTLEGSTASQLVPATTFVKFP